MVLAVLIAAAILTAWVPSRWAVSLFQTGVFALAGAFAVRHAVRPAPIRVTFPLVALSGAVVWCLVQLGANQTVYRWETWNATLHWTTNLLVFFLASQYSNARPLLRVALYFGFVLAVVATVQTFTAGGNVFWLFPSGYSDLVLGPFVYHNYYAAFIELILPLAITGALLDRRRRLLYAFFSGVLYASVVAAASRAGIILVSLEIVIIMILAVSRKLIAGRTLAITLGALSASAVVFSLIVGPGFVVQRLQYKNPFVGRREMNLSSLDMIRERPLIGFGLGTWPTVYPKFASYDDGLFANQAHNDWAQWAAEGGLPFVLLMASIAIWAVRPAVRSLWGFGVLAVLAHCAVDYPLQKPAVAAFFFFILGLLAACTAASPGGKPAIEPAFGSSMLDPYRHGRDDDSG
jgi:O-antigen ligase